MYQRICTFNLVLVAMLGIVSVAGNTVWAVPSGSINSPEDGDCLKGTVSVMGTVSGGQNGLNSWVLEYSKGCPPETSAVIIANGTTPKSNEKLADWDTIIVSNDKGDGEYTLRLKVTDKLFQVTVVEICDAVDNIRPVIETQLSSYREALGDYSKSYTTSAAKLLASGRIEDTTDCKLISAKLVKQYSAPVADVTDRISITNREISGEIPLAQIPQELLADATELRLILEVEDCPGNNTMGGSNVLLIDDVPPTAQILNPAENANFNKGMIPFDGAASDNFSGVNRVELSFPDGYRKADGTTTWALLYPLQSENITLNVQVRAYDNAGNVGEFTDSVKVNYYLSWPAVNIISPVDESGVSWCGSDIEIRGLVDDSDYDYTDFSWSVGWAPGECADEIHETLASGTTPVINNTLALWNTCGLQKDRHYTILLKVKNKNMEGFYTVKRCSMLVSETVIPPPTITDVSPNSGPTTGGTEVTITGTNFLPGAKVLIGNESARIISLSESRIEIETPPGSAGDADIVIINPRGGSARRIGGFTYVLPAKPEIVCVVPAVGTPTGNQDVTIQGAGFKEGATVKFGDTEATDVNFVDSETITAKTPAGTNTVAVCIINPGDEPVDDRTGCLDNGYVYSNDTTSLITSPLDGDCLRGVVRVKGIAYGGQNGLQNWLLEYAKDCPPTTTYTMISNGSEETNGCVWLGEWDTTALEDGNYILRLSVKDNIGNTRRAQVCVNVDNTPLEADISVKSSLELLGDETNVFTRSNATLIVEGKTEPGAEVVSAKLLQQGDVPFRILPNDVINIDEDGNITGAIPSEDLSMVAILRLRLDLRDRCGNQASALSNLLFVDNIPPTCNIIEPSDNANFNRLPIPIIACSEDTSQFITSGVDKVQVSKDGATWFDMESDAEIWTYSLQSLGTNTIVTVRVRAIDSAGNSTREEDYDTIQIQYYLQEPTVNINAFGCDDSVSGVVKIIGTVDDTNYSHDDFCWAVGWGYGKDASEPWEWTKECNKAADEPIIDSLLAEWDTTNIAKEQYYTIFVKAINDTTPNGHTARRTVYLTGSDLGDVSGDGLVTALDAALILRHIVGLITLDDEQQAIGDVTQNGALSALDAACILRYAVGIITSFPCSIGATAPELTGESSIHLSIGEFAGKPGESIEIPINIEGNASDLMSGVIVLRFDPSILSVAQDSILAVAQNSILANANQDSTLLTATTDGEIRIAFASTSPIATKGALFNLPFAVSESATPQSKSVLELTTIQLNEGRISVKKTDGIFHVQSVSTVLLPNYPNPFNPETWIPFQLANDADVTLHIYNVKGQLVRAIHLGQKRAGAHISRSRALHWNGRNDCGEKVASGVYFYTLQADDNFKATRKMMILK